VTPAVTSQLGHLVVALMILGMATIFLVFDARAATTRAMAVMLGAIGVGMLLNVPDQLGWSTLSGVSSLLVNGTLEMIGFIAGVEWVLRVRRTVARQAGRRNLGEWLLRLAQGLLLAVWIVELAFGGLEQPRWDYLFTEPGRFFTLVFWIQALPMLIAMALTGFSILLMVAWRPDKAEVARLRAMVLSAPFLASPLLWPPDAAHWEPVTVAVGLVIFLAGAIHYLIIQSQRGQLMGRFISPQVAESLRRSGLEPLLKPHHADITALYCDLRGFTAFADQVPSTQVMKALREYYQVVGDAAAAHNGTVKDHAGDGVLILFGAPVPSEHHAEDGYRAAVEIVREVNTRLAEEGVADRLGIGAGMASGRATVGAIEGGSRLEYAAIGTVVNLSARLCEAAGSGEVLLVSDRLDLQEAPVRWIDAKGLADRVEARSIRVTMREEEDKRDGRKRRRRRRRRVRRSDRRR